MQEQEPNIFRRDVLLGVLGGVILVIGIGTFIIAWIGSVSLTSTKPEAISNADIEIIVSQTVAAIIAELAEVTPTPTNTFEPATATSITVSPSTAPPTEAATSTPTMKAATPSPTPSPTPAQVSLGCNHPTLVDTLFPQLVDYELFYQRDEGAEEFFVCEGIIDETRDGAPVLRVNYADQDDAKKFGYLGIGPLNAYDISASTNVCLLVYSDQPLQAFDLKMKDVDNIERSVSLSTTIEGDWHELCVPIEEFASQRVDVTRLENISLGFDTKLGAASLLIAEIVFRSTE